MDYNQGHDNEYRLFGEHLPRAVEEVSDQLLWKPHQQSNHVEY